MKKINNNKSFIKNFINISLIRKFFYFKIKPKKIFIDNFTQKAINTLHVLFPNTIITQKITYDCDLILSNKCYSSIIEIKKQTKIWYDYLSMNGILFFSCFGYKTLEEIKNAWKNIDSFNHINDMVDKKNLGDMLYKYYQNVVIDSEVIYFSYKNKNKIFNDIRSFNINLNNNNFRKTLTGKVRWKNFLLKLKLNEQVIISYEPMYTLAQKLIVNQKIFLSKIKKI